MSPPERFPLDDSREWMNRARSNLVLAKNRIPDAYFEDLCFAAQQTTENAIKAVMITREVDFPYVHDLGSLLSLLETTGEAVPEAMRAAVSLTTYATATRYPNTGVPVTEQEYQDAVAIAEAVVRWAEKRL